MYYICLKMSIVVNLNKELMMTSIFLWHQLGDSFLLTLFGKMYMIVCIYVITRVDGCKATSFTFPGYDFILCYGTVLFIQFSCSYK